MHALSTFHLLSMCGLLLSEFGGVGCDGRREVASGTCSRARAQSNLAHPVDFRKVRGSRFSLGTAINQSLHRRCDRNNTRLSVQKPIVFLAIVWLTVEWTEASTWRGWMSVLTTSPHTPIPAQYLSIETKASLGPRRSN
jgi:hypothetical protein